MANQEHQLTVRYIPTRHNTLKLFALYSPVNLEEFTPLALYRELSIPDEQFAMDILMALKNSKKGKQIFLNEMLKHWKVIPSMFDGEDLLSKATYFLNQLQKELMMFNLYQDDVLPFNSMWMEGSDSLIFFRMDKHDV